MHLVELQRFNLMELSCSNMVSTMVANLDHWIQSCITMPPPPQTSSLMLNANASPANMEELFWCRRTIGQQCQRQL